MTGILCHFEDVLLWMKAEGKASVLLDRNIETISIRTKQSILSSIGLFPGYSEAFILESVSCHTRRSVGLRARVYVKAKRQAVTCSYHVVGSKNR